MVAEARRGYIYEFDDNKVTNKRYVLVVSNDARATDRMVNVIMFGDSDLGHDVVKVQNEVFGVKYLHCGMLTYSKREFLTKEVGKVSSKTMEKVEQTICKELSLREDVVAERNFYKNTYSELLAKVLSLAASLNNS